MSKPRRKLNRDGDEQKYLIEFCVSKKREFVNEFLKDNGLRPSSNREELRQALHDYIEQGDLSIDELAKFLNRVEGWGNQHIFFYHAPPGSFSLWRDATRVKTLLANNNVYDLLNAPRPVLMPDRPQLSTIELSDNRLKFIWVQKKIWYQRQEDQDELRDEDIVLRAFRMHVERRITWFELNLISGHDYLSIPNIAKANADVEPDERGTTKKKKDHYEVLRQRFETELAPFLSVSSYPRTRIRKAITALEASDEVMARTSGSETIAGNKVIFQSSDEQTDIKSDKILADYKLKMPQGIKSTEGSYYWQEGYNGLTKNLFVKMSVHSSCIAFREQLSEQDVRNVLQRIRILCP